MKFKNGAKETEKQKKKKKREEEDDDVASIDSDEFDMLMGVYSNKKPRVRPHFRAFRVF